ncbi:MAG: hypothetical protein K0U93_17725 [Gammaproteobacteria bacterium]|nr:hypothetical protein [Gammaproteobacteria bacterium]
MNDVIKRVDAGEVHEQASWLNRAGWYVAVPIACAIGLAVVRPLPQACSGSGTCLVERVARAPEDFWNRYKLALTNVAAHPSKVAARSQPQSEKSREITPGKATVQAFLF